MYKLAELHLAAANLMSVLYPLESMFHLTMSNWCKANTDCKYWRYRDRCAYFGIDPYSTKVYQKCKQLDDAGIHHTQEQQATILDAQAA